MGDEHDDDLEPEVEEGDGVETEHFPDAEAEDEEEAIVPPNPTGDESDDRDADKSEL